jgi:hypothetical protein
MEDIIKIYEKLKYFDEIIRKVLKRITYVNDRLNNKV